MVSTFEVMSPLFQSSDDGKHLGVVDPVISLNRIQHFQQKGDRVPGLIVARLLGENCSNSNAKAISLKLKWKIVIREYQNRSQIGRLGTGRLGTVVSLYHQ
jgi:hypothetical protein